MHVAHVALAFDDSARFNTSRWVYGSLWFSPHRWALVPALIGLAIGYFGQSSAQDLPLDELPDFGKQVRKVEDKLGERGRVVIRYSGTEPKARIMVEGEDEGRVSEIAQDLAHALQRALAGVGG